MFSCFSSQLSFIHFVVHLTPARRKIIKIAFSPTHEQMKDESEKSFCLEAKHTPSLFSKLNA
jgi:hypothetical protein